MTQGEFDFTHKWDNNEHSQKILEANRVRLNSQNHLVLKLMNEGKRLTVKDAMNNYGVGDLRRRIKDLRDNGIDIKDNIINGRFKEYFL